MPKRAEHAHHVHAVVLVKPLIFGGDERLPHMQRDRIQRHIDAVLTPVETAGALAIGVVDDARLIELREFLKIQRFPVPGLEQHHKGRQQRRDHTQDRPSNPFSLHRYPSRSDDFFTPVASSISHQRLN